MGRGLSHCNTMYFTWHINDASHLCCSSGEYGVKGFPTIKLLYVDASGSVKSQVRCSILVCNTVDFWSDKMMKVSKRFR